MPLDGIAFLAARAAERIRGDASGWFLPALAFAMVLFWIVITTLIALVAGHMKLLRRFPPVPERVVQRFRFASGRMRGASFNNGLYVGLGARGLHLAPVAIARPIFSRGVPCIPWHELRLVRAQEDGLMGSFAGAAFEIPSAKLRFTLFGKAGVAVAERVAAGASAEPQPSRANRMMRE